GTGDGSEVQVRRRKPAVERKISEIREEDTRVSLIGRVIKVDKMDYMFWLDDGTGVAIIESESDLPKVGQVVRVIGRIIRNEEGIHIYAEVIQDFSDADLEALEEIRELERKLLPRLEGEIVW
uniref:RPA14 subunit of the hetero-oligomeric complex involved in homologous recombination n=1 Tax=Pyrococcus abyssi (strain GE5 / Orsay) TaxID=272844 RepID=UPI00247B2DF0|nr:Chain C, RPA14 subunit of the hetero-oligomeric complex involved in homologous recombination [Pyrococcus abyssi GE5]8AAS_C Chain C, RPA14 subunit of the hetero-oligomeric complex involved in homologous recombination [Pyrococcus abyssi GE5]8OEJ_C Chain C, RPA14 subunit of the hetero-oligomeric complex involved in homologous recombination [Pyrococcus abyssi]8OEJ_I Chain I, RPA14 subunit of the hetero-oligomeric complex involved in homologous recombination [Pyrococcus abyssi]8OEL_C Chain C, RPA